MRILDKGTVTAASVDADGVLLPPAPPPSGSGPNVNVPGDWRLQYTYDGLGRLARKESPVTPGGSEARREDYRYDGVRRIQEAVTRWSGAVVIPGGEEQGASGGSNPGEPGEGDPGAITLGGLEEPVEATELEPFGEGTLLMALPEEWDQREYVWGPDYVDELAFQFDRDGRPLYALLDANYNVMAIIAGGVRPCGNIDADPYDDTVPAGTVLEQYVWSPYGELLALELLIPLAKGESPRNRAGHQGLFFERFDGENTDPPLVATDPITGEGKGWYYNRNRWYDATMGRFTTADPNETAIVALSSMAMNASAFDVILASTSVMGQYHDGLNLFSHLSANPVYRNDPLGLFGGFSDVMGSTAVRGSLMALNAATMFSSGVSFFEKVFYGAGLWSALADVAIDAAIDRIGGKAFDLAIDGFRAGTSMLGNLFKRTCSRPSSFVAGTLVETHRGLVPIEAVHEGDLVFSRQEDFPNSPTVLRRVTGVVTGSDSILWIISDDGRSIGVTSEHEFFINHKSWVRACELSAGDELEDVFGRSIAVREIVADCAPVSVFNLEVDGTFTYFVDGAWVHNQRKCRLWSEGTWNEMVGNAYEQWVHKIYGWVKYNGDKLHHNGTNFVPDYVTSGGGLIFEIKSGKRITRTKQLEAMAGYSEANGLGKPTLILSDSNEPYIADWILHNFDIAWGP